MDVEDARTIGARLRQIRNSRKKSLRVIAGLAGMSKSRLSKIERGESVLDRRLEIVALADALQIAPSELTKLPMPAPENGDADSAEDAVRLALLAVNHDRPGGQVVAVDVLRARVMAVLDARCRCDRQAEAAALARVRKRHDDAVMAFRRAETISPVHLHRSPLARDTLAKLVARSRRDAVGRELRGMAYRAGLPVQPIG